MKKIGAIVLVIMMIAMVGAASADSMGTNGVVTSDDTTVTLKKGIVLYNTEGSNIYYPEITYTYTIATAAPAATTTITDDDGDTVTVSAGVTNGVTLTDNTAVFTKASTSQAAATGTEVYDTITASVDLSKFSKAGVYRYVITETDNTASLTAAGLIRPSGYVSTRYLDVYIGNGGTVNETSNPAGLKVVGFVCFTSSDATKIIDGKTITNSTIEGKSEGFVDTLDEDESTQGANNTTGKADQYHTYNVTITKSVQGTLANKVNPFPFEINTSGVTNQPFSVTTTGSSLSVTDAGAVDSSKKAVIGTAFTGALADGKEIKIYGLPANTSITKIEETNNTSDIYKVKYELDGDVVVTEAEVTSNAKKDLTTTQVVTNYSAYDDTTITQIAIAYTVTNTLAEISPTGYVSRFAPYALILVGGIILLVIAKKHKKHTEEE
jgi:uncharacterized protein YbcV (DUF1398 family)